MGRKKKSAQVADSGTRPKRRLRKLLFLAVLAGVGTTVAKKLGSAGPSAGPVPTPPPAPPRPTPTAAPEPVAQAPSSAPAPAEADAPEVETAAETAEETATAPEETPAAEPGEETPGEALAPAPEVPADSLTSFFDEVLNENEEKKRTRRR